MPKFVLSGASGLLVRGNIDIDARSFVAVPVPGRPGTFASVRTCSWHMEPQEMMQRYNIWRPNGAEVLVPTVIRRGGKWVILHDRGGLAHYLKTGRHLGVFTDAHHATMYGNRLHLEQARTGTARMRAANG